jgi:uracil-DNA glycosylase
MYICLKNDYPSFNPPPNKGGLLTPWADRGVLMLNTCLTVRAHEANSHSNRGWERFTQKCIDLVAARRTRGVVFMAWGTPAGKRVLRVDGKRHLVLKTVHPSPLSASNGYFTCRHFRLANDWLAERYGPAGRVDWALNEGESVFDDEEKQEAAAEDKKEKEEEKVKEKEGVEEKEEKGKGFDEEEDGDVEDGDAADMLEAVVKAEAGVKAAALSSSFSSAAAALSLSSSSAAAAENSNAAEKEPVVAEERKTRSQKGAAEAPDGEENAAPEVEA